MSGVPEHFFCSCVRSLDELSSNRDDYVESVDGRWANKACLCKGVGIVVGPRVTDVSCVCLVPSIEIPVVDRHRYVRVKGAPESLAKRDCLCGGSGVDPRLSALARSDGDSVWLIDYFNGRVKELERHILRLNARIEGDPEPPRDTEYVPSVDGP